MKAPWNKMVTGHRPWAQTRNLPLPSVPSPTPPRLGTGLPVRWQTGSGVLRYLWAGVFLHLMFSIGHGSGTSILYLLFLLPNPPRDNRKGPKSGMAAQETSSGDTSPSSHALSSGPHVRSSQRGAFSVARVLGGSSHFPLSAFRLDTSGLCYLLNTSGHHLRSPTIPASWIPDGHQKKSREGGRRPLSTIIGSLPGS